MSKNKKHSSASVKVIDDEAHPEPKYTLDWLAMELEKNHTPKAAEAKPTFFKNCYHCEVSTSDDSCPSCGKDISTMANARSNWRRPYSVW